MKDSVTRFISLGALSLSALGLACASDGRGAETPAGMSSAGTGAEGGDDTEVGAVDDAPPEEPAAAHGGAPEPAEPPVPVESREERHARELAEKQAALARAASDAVAAPNNDLGLVFTLADRASDLPWLLVIENRGEEPVRLAALPELISFELAAEDDAPPRRCAAATLPKAIGEEELVTLAPKEMLTYFFDPRPLCEDASWLSAGKKVTPLYGLPKKTKKVWQKGKSVEVEDTKGTFDIATRPRPPAPPVDPKAPKVAAGKPVTPPPDAPPEPVYELRRLEGPTFVLGSTYPLDGVTPIPTDPKKAGAAAAADGAQPTPGEETPLPDAAPGSNPEPEPPPDVMTLSVSPLGTTSVPDQGTVTVTVKNVSGKGQHLFLRRELITFELTGPLGAATCRMHPSGRAPDKSQFSFLASGGSTSLTTRLPEACPPGTFDAPGTYAVSARLFANQTGAEHDLSAFTGVVTTTRPGRFVVKGKEGERARVMRVLKR